MAENQTANSNENPERRTKLNELFDAVIDSAIKAAPEVSKDLVIDVAREALGLSKKSDLRKGSKSYKLSIFLKEITPTVLLLTVAGLIIYTFFIVLWRWLGV